MSWQRTQVHSTWLKTVVLSRNCTKPPSGAGWGVTSPTDIHLFASAASGPGGGASPQWTWRSLVAVGNRSGGAEGADENDVAVLDDGSLLCVFRRDGGDGWPRRPGLRVQIECTAARILSK